jgi:hypothetical protein
MDFRILADNSNDIWLHLMKIRSVCMQMLYGTSHWVKCTAVDWQKAAEIEIPKIR